MGTSVRKRKSKIKKVDLTKKNGHEVGDLTDPESSDDGVIHDDDLNENHI